MIKVDALYLRFNEELYCESDEVSSGIIIDYSQKGKIIGLEVLNAKHFPDNLVQLKRLRWCLVLKR